MAIIKPTRQFDGSNISKGGNSYFKPEYKLMTFREDFNAEGSYVFILPAYRLDATGTGGVWYRVLKIRDNFGPDLQSKEKFVPPDNCPVEYFARQAQVLYPGYNKAKRIEQDGKTSTIYPPHGRNSWRVLYNAAYFDQRSRPAGPHVLDLPATGGASEIDKFLKGSLPDGTPNPIINDPSAAYPVFIKLDLKVKNGQPWSIQINTQRSYQLDVSLCDSSILPNLDNVCKEVCVEDLYNKLKKIIPPEIFNNCMRDYSDPSFTVSLATPTMKPMVYGAPGAYDNNPPPMLPGFNAPPAPPVSVAPTFNPPPGMPSPFALRSSTPQPAVNVQAQPMQHNMQGQAPVVEQVEDDVPFNDDNMPTPVGMPIPNKSSFNPPGVQPSATSQDTRARALRALQQ